MKSKPTVPLPGNLKSILDRSNLGQRLSTAEGVTLLESDHLAAIGRAADNLARRLHPEGYRTFNIDRNINYTNICENECRFCAFWRNADDADAYVLTLEQLIQKIDETVRRGGNQILLQGGVHPGLDIGWFEKMLSGIKGHFPQINIHGLSPPEIFSLAKSEELSLKETLERLRDAGLGSIPGGGAEILSNRVRTEVSPKKINADQWIEVMRTWHSLGGRSTATMMFGHCETMAERIEHLERIRQLQDETGGFTAFICWPFQSGNTELSHMPKVEPFEYLRTLATARLYLDNFPSIQASWVTQGIDVGRTALDFGANDMGSLMLEENVVASAGTAFNVSLDDICNAITDSGFRPRQRDVFYRLVPIEQAMRARMAEKELVEESFSITPVAGTHSIKTVSIVGAGVMGRDIGWLATKSGFTVLMADAAEKALLQTDEELGPDFDDSEKDLFSTLTPGEYPQNADIVLESVAENIDLKKRIYQTLEAELAPGSILASNTSTIPITKLAEGMRHPERFCGMHFFYPARETRLVEIIPGQRTTPETIHAVEAFAQSIGKTPVTVSESPGFLVNRLLTPFMNEATELLRRGATIQQIDSAAEAFGVPTGPLAFYDKIGLDTAIMGGRTLWEAFSDRVIVSPILVRLFKKGRLGRKTGAGFYRYPDPAGPRQLDPEVDAIIETYMEKETREYSNEEIVHQLLLPMLLEATRLLDEGVVAHARDVDVGITLGLEFLQQQGGLLHWADTLGPNKILEMIKPYQELGPRFHPTPLLMDMAATEGRFFSEETEHAN